MIKFVTIFTLIFLMVQNAHADGKQLSNYCQLALDIGAGIDKDKIESMHAGYCIGFIGGITDLNTIIKAGSGTGLFCIPTDIGVEDKIKTVVSYIETNTKSQSEPNAGAALAAFIKAYPC